MLVIIEGPTDKLGDTTIAAEVKCSLILLGQERKSKVYFTIQLTVFLYTNGLKI